MFATRTIVDLARRRDRDHGSRSAPAGAARDARPADRRRPRGRGAAAVAVRPLRAAPGSASIAVAVALLLVGLLGTGLSTTQRLLAIGVGALALFLGVAMLAPTLVPPLARVLGWPATRSAARPGNSRAPTRCAIPHAPPRPRRRLMIGLALVTLVGVLAAGLRTSFVSAVNEVFVADYALTATNNFTPISVASAERAASVPGSRGRRGRPRRRREGVRLEDPGDRRRTGHQPGDLRQLEGGKPADARPAR